MESIRRRATATFYAHPRSRRRPFGTSRETGGTLVGKTRRAMRQIRDTFVNSVRSKRPSALRRRGGKRERERERRVSPRRREAPFYDDTGIIGVPVVPRLSREAEFSMRSPVKFFVKFDVRPREIGNYAGYYVDLASTHAHDGYRCHSQGPCPWAETHIGSIRLHI